MMKNLLKLNLGIHNSVWVWPECEGLEESTWSSNLLISSSYCTHSGIIRIARANLGSFVSGLLHYKQRQENRSAVQCSSEGKHLLDQWFWQLICSRHYTRSHTTATPGEDS